MKASRAWYLLLLLPFVGTLLPFFYNRASPALFGLPFFYWYQLLWVVLTSLLLGVIALVFRQRDV
ncbi:MAG TPA: DUF3311 domain-containing protein [Candidatus Tumulicola sp.]